MTKAPGVQSAANAAHQMAQLLDQQEETTEWWGRFGKAFHDFSEAILVMGPVDKEHRDAFKQRKQQ